MSSSVRLGDREADAGVGEAGAGAGKLGKDALRLNRAICDGR
jgi:hypothetical protein